MWPLWIGKRWCPNNISNKRKQRENDTEKIEEEDREIMLIKISN